MPKGQEPYRPAATEGAESDLNAELDTCVGVLENEFDYVYQSLRRRGLSPADAEDVVQEVFLIMWRRWGIACWAK